MVDCTSFRDRDGFAIAVAQGSQVGVYVRAFDKTLSGAFVREQAFESVEDIEAGRIVVELHPSKVAAGSAVMSGEVSRAAFRVGR